MLLVIIIQMKSVGVLPCSAARPGHHQGATEEVGSIEFFPIFVKECNLRFQKHDLIFFFFLQFSLNTLPSHSYIPSLCSNCLLALNILLPAQISYAQAVALFLTVRLSAILCAPKSSALRSVKHSLIIIFFSVILSKFPGQWNARNSVEQ